MSNPPKQLSPAPPEIEVFFLGETPEKLRERFHESFLDQLPENSWVHLVATRPRASELPELPGTSWSVPEQPVSKSQALHKAMASHRSGRRVLFFDASIRASRGALRRLEICLDEYPEASFACAWIGYELSPALTFAAGWGILESGRPFARGHRLPHAKARPSLAEVLAGDFLFTLIDGPRFLELGRPRPDFQDQNAYLHYFWRASRRGLRGLYEPRAQVYSSPGYRYRPPQAWTQAEIERYRLDLELLPLDTWAQRKLWVRSWGQDLGRALRQGRGLSFLGQSLGLLRELPQLFHRRRKERMRTRFEEDRRQGYFAPERGNGSPERPLYEYGPSLPRRLDGLEGF